MRTHAQWDSQYPPHTEYNCFAVINCPGQETVSGKTLWSEKCDSRQFRKDVRSQLALQSNGSAVRASTLPPDGSLRPLGECHQRPPVR